MSRVPKSPTDLKSVIEKNALVVIIVCVFGVSSAVYGVVNAWHVREYKLKSAELEKHYKDEFAKLESERARIKVTIETESKTLSADRIFVSPQKLPPDYSVVEGGVFAVPPIQEGKDKWTWKTRNEFELIGEAFGPKQLKEMISEKERKLLEKTAATFRLSCYESGRIHEIKAHGYTIALRPRAFFQRISWEDISRAQTDANAGKVEGLFDWLDSIGDNIDVWSVEELILTTPETPIEKKIKLLNDTDFVSSELARVSMKQAGRVNLFLGYIAAHFGPDLAQKLSKSFRLKRDELQKKQDKKKEEAAQRKQQPVKIEPDRLETFLSVFSAIGSGNGASPFGEFKATDYTFRDNAFSVQGYYNLKTAQGIESGVVTRIYILRIGLMRDDGIYAIGLVYPADNDFSGLRQAMSLIDGARILM
jgi:hypothetical protein